MRENVKVSIGKYILELLKALAIALVITLVLLLIGAFVVKIFNISTKYIDVINQIIKGLSIFLSTIVCFRYPLGGYLRGFVLGFAYIIISLSAIWSLVQL